MGDKTLAACKECGCVYLHAVGGAAQVLAECIKKVRNVYLMEQFGAPEAIWEFEVEDFPAVVTMDAHGTSLHKEIFARSQAALMERL
jgi:fumarate hydratase class I